MKQSIGVNMVKLLSGKVIGQLSIVVTIPVLTRVFLPEHFGVMQIFESIATILFVISCLKYELSIPLGKTRQEASASFLLSVFFTCIITGCSFAGVFLGRTHIARWFQSPQLADFLWLLPAFVFVFGWGHALSYWASYEGRFGTIAWSGLVQQVCDRVVTILLGFLLRSSVIGLFIGRFAGITANTLILLVSFRQALLETIKRAMSSFATIRTVAMRHKKFPLFSTWTHLLSVVTVQIPSLVFGLYFSPTILGYYSLASRVGTMPISLLAQAIGQVFYPAAAKEYHQTGTVSRIVETTFKLLVQLAMFPMAVLGLFGATLFGVVFGQQWTEAGIYAQILASWYFLSFLSVPLDIFALVNRQDLGLFFTILNFAGRTASLFLGVALGFPRTTLGIFVLASVVLLSGQLFWKLRFSHLSGRWAFTIILKQLMLSLVLLLPVKGLSWLSEAVWVELAGLCLAIGGYILIMLLTEPSLQEFLRKG